MSPLELSNDERRAALAKALEMRIARASVKRRLKQRELTLAQVFKMADEDPVIGRIKVVKLLESLPRVGAITAARTIEEIGISPSRRIQGLGARQREELLRRFAPRQR